MSLFAYSDQLNAKRVVLIGHGRTEEAPAGGAIVPGQLIKLGSTGSVVVHATAGGAAEKAFAVEDALQARTLDDAYAADDPVNMHLGKSADVINGFLADGENVVVGDLLESAGNGDLRKLTSGVALAVALKALDLSASSNTTHGRLPFRLL